MNEKPILLDMEMNNWSTGMTANGTAIWRAER